MRCPVPAENPPEQKSSGECVGLSRLIRVPGAPWPKHWQRPPARPKFGPDQAAAEANRRGAMAEPY
jgi:hypothetical protein